MNYTEIEKMLIKKGEAYRSSPNANITMFYDETPFETLPNGYKARATKFHGEWKFRAIVRRGFTNNDFPTLEESIEAGEKEKAEWLSKMEREDEEFEQRKAARKKA